MYGEEVKKAMLLAKPPANNINPKLIDFNSLGQFIPRNNGRVCLNPAVAVACAYYGHPTNAYKGAGGGACSRPLRDHHFLYYAEYGLSSITSKMNGASFPKATPYLQGQRHV
jgi:hypothetical protein